ncbi:MAG: hypothetical protein BroJett039_06680 [Chloroflexota bacterium]|nr:MAG: hypothetical protein BroJett039_06680 [Chloroflexota bacterium]
MSSKSVLVVCVSLLLVSLIGCGAVTSDITFFQNEEWKADTTLVLNPQENAQLGATLEAELQKRAAQAKNEGLVLNWSKSKQDENTAYRITAEGAGWNELNKFAFDNQAELTTNGNQITVAYRSLGFGARALTLKLTGGSIVSSNADEVKGNTAIWYNLGSSLNGVQAVLTPASKSPISGVPCIGGAAILALIPFGLVRYTRRKHQT